MKRFLNHIIPLTLVLAIILFSAGCVTEKNTVNLKMGTGGTTGTYYGYGGALAYTFNKKLSNVNISVQATGASKANLLLLEEGTIDMAIVQNDVMDYAYNGTELFKETGAVKGFSAVAGLYGEVCQIVTTKGIVSIEDLKGKRVSVGDLGSGVEFNARQILEAYGLAMEDIEAVNLDFADSSNALKSGKIDAFFCTAGAPTTAIANLSTLKSISLLPIDDEHTAALTAGYPFYTKYAIPSESYVGVRGDIQTVAVKATLVVSNGLSEEFVYKMTKTMFANKTAITAGHAKGEELDAAYAVEGITVPLHPGAERYYKEIGVLSK